jgi:8-oxo-dGTP pyrophosphatase MutT (NUDIX family)
MAEGLPTPASVHALLPASAPHWVETLRDQLVDVEAVDEREAGSIEALRDRLTWGADPSDERADPRHVTASAFVVSSRGIVLHRHRILGIWVQPGGHIDPGETPLEAATREVLEETGLVTRPLSPAVVHVDCHQGPRGHTHYDLRYLLMSDPVDPSPPAGESQEVFWFSFDDAMERAEPALRAALAKVATMVAGLSGTLET